MDPDQLNAVTVPEGFVLDQDVTPLQQFDLETQGDPLSAVPPEVKDERDPLQYSVEVPDGFYIQTDDIMGKTGKAEFIQAAKAPGILERAKRFVRDVIEPPEERIARSQTVVYLAKKNRLPIDVVDKNFDMIVKNNRLTGFFKDPTKDQQERIAFTQSLAEAVTFGAFDPDPIIKRDFPLQAASGAVGGGVLTFMATGGILQALGLGNLAIKAGVAGEAIFAAAPRFLPPAIMTGSTFATVKGINKAVEQVENKEIKPLEVGKEATIGFVEGFGLGAIGQSVGYTRRIFMAGGLGYVSGKAQGYNDTEALVQGAIWGGIETLGGIGRDQKLKENVIYNLRNRLAQYAKQKMPSMSAEESMTAANQYINRMAGGKLNKAIKETPVKYLEKANQIISKMLKDWRGVKNVNVLGTEMATNKALATAPGKEAESFINKPMAMAGTPEPTPSIKPVKPLMTQAQKGKREKKKAKLAKQEKIGEISDIKGTATELVRQRRAEINVSNFETNLFINDIEQLTTKEQREIIPFLIERTNVPAALGRPDLIETFKKDAENLRPLANQIKEHFDRGWAFMQENMEELSAQQIENYVTHIWDVKGSKKRETTSWFVTRNKFLKKRYIETYKKGIEELGLKPKTLDISEIIRIHDSIMNKTIANNKLVKELNKLKVNGLPLIERVDLAPNEWIYFDNPALNKKMFVPGDPKRADKVSDEMITILNEIGFTIGRKIAPTVFGNPSPLGLAIYFNEPPEIRLQRFFSNRTFAHELGHLLDGKIGLGGVKGGHFINTFKDEIYKINEARIKAHTGRPGKYGKQYAESPDEQIAEFFAHYFIDPKGTFKIAPNASAWATDLLRKDKVLTKLVDFNFEQKAKDQIIEQMNTLVKLPVKVHPDLEKPLRVVFDQRFNHPIINSYEAVNGVLKKLQLSISLFHHFALGETSIATMGIGKTLSVALDLRKIYAALAKGDYAAFKNAEQTKKWIERGLQIGATADIPVHKIQEALNSFAVKTKNKAIIGKAAGFLSTFNETWDKALWNYYHDTLKLYAVEHLSSQIDPNVSLKKQEEEIAQIVNDTFGGQNWENLMVSPKTLQIASWALLSPDWTLSTIRQAMSPTGAGAIHDESVALRKKLGRMFWLKALLYFGVGINLLNATNRKKDAKEHPEQYKDAKFLDYTMVGNAIGHKSHLFAGRYKDGSERYIRWGKQFREVPELFMDDLSFSPVSASLKKLGGKAAPNMQIASTVFTGHSLSGFEVREISEAEGWDRTFAIVKDLLKKPLPFSARNLVNDERESFISDIAMPSSKGMTRWKAVKLYKIGIERGDERVIKEVYQDAIDNNLPARTLLRAAATSLKAERTKELKKNSENVEDVESLMAKTTDKRDLKRLGLQKARMIKDKAEIQAVIKGMHIFENEIKKLEVEFGF